MRTALRMPAEHADLIVECLTSRWRGHLEENTETDTTGLLALYEQLRPDVDLIRELQEQDDPQPGGDERVVADPTRVREIAKEHMDVMEQEVGREHSCLLRVQAGDRDYFVEGQTQAEAEASTREALLAREVFEAIRDEKDEVVSVGVTV